MASIVGKIFGWFKWFWRISDIMKEAEDAKSRANAAWDKASEFRTEIDQRMDGDLGTMDRRLDKLVVDVDGRFDRRTEKLNADYSAMLERIARLEGELHNALYGRNKID